MDSSPVALRYCPGVNRAARSLLIVFFPSYLFGAQLLHNGIDFSSRPSVLTTHIEIQITQRARNEPPAAFARTAARGLVGELRKEIGISCERYSRLSYPTMAQSAYNKKVPVNRNETRRGDV